MQIPVIIQARMDSKRLPGKMMLEVNDKPILAHVIERLQCSKIIDTIIVATSKQDEDGAIADYCAGCGIECFRGDLNNVALRFKDIITYKKFEYFIRICADSPLIDYKIIEQAVGVFKDSNYDVVTNTMERTFPKGQSVEIVKTKVFLKAYENMQDALDFEHVTRYFYQNADMFNIFNIRAAVGDYSHIRLSVDTYEDFIMFKHIIKVMKMPLESYRWLDVVKIYLNIHDKLHSGVNI